MDIDVENTAVGRAEINVKSRIARNAAEFRALVRGKEFLLLPIALVIGCIAASAVAVMSWIAQLARVVIFGIPLDVRLSAQQAVNPMIALAAPAIGGLILGWMEWSRRRWKMSNAIDPIEANALRGGNLSLRDSLVVSAQKMLSNGCGASVGLEAGYTQSGASSHESPPQDRRPAASLGGGLLPLKRPGVPRACSAPRQRFARSNKASVMPPAGSAGDATGTGLSATFDGLGVRCAEAEACWITSLPGPLLTDAVPSGTSSTGASMAG